MPEISAQKIKELEEATGILYVNNFSLTQWLDLFKNPPEDKIFADYAFPTDQLKNEYISTIRSRTDDEIKMLLERFLIQSGSLGTDQSLLETLIEINKTDPDRFDHLSKKQFNKRLILHSIGVKTPPWEGITWVIDLLPDFPNQAIEALNSYFLAHIQVFPDGRSSGLADAISLIRAKYIGLPEKNEERINLLNTLSSRDFEHLVESLYRKMRYETKLTPPQKDGGRDVIAKRHQLAKKESLLIECKLHKNPIGIETVRQLLGVVSSEKVNKGVLVTSSKFTRGSTQFSKDNPRIELIDGYEFITLLAENFGSKWVTDIDKIIFDSKRRNQKDK